MGLIIYFLLPINLSPLFSSSALQPKEVFFTLPNELKVLLINRPASRLIHLVLGVAFGSRDEEASHYGLAHFLEHIILFRGTRSISLDQLYQELRQHGAWVNAHTGRDVTLFELSLPAEELHSGLPHFIDLIFNLNITEEELDQEKEIILEEMNLQKSEPLSLATDLAYAHLFPGHAYAHSIVGEKETVINLSREEIMKAYETYYQPANCSLAVVGEVENGSVEKIIRQHFSRLEGAKVTRPVLASPSPLSKIARVGRKLGELQTHLVIAGPAPDLYSPEQYAFDVLIAILGRGLNPLLVTALGTKRIPLAGVSISYYSHQYAGIWLMHLVLEPKNASLAETAVLRFLRQLPQENYSPDDVLGELKDYIFDYLGSGKNLVRLAAEKALEDGYSLASSAAMFLLLMGGKTLPPYLETVNKVTSSDLRRVASKYMAKPELVVITVEPETKKEEKD